MSTSLGRLLSSLVRISLIIALYWLSMEFNVIGGGKPMQDFVASAIFAVFFEAWFIEIGTAIHMYYGGVPSPSINRTGLIAVPLLNFLAVLGIYTCSIGFDGWAMIPSLALSLLVAGIQIGTAMAFTRRHKLG